MTKGRIIKINHRPKIKDAFDRPQIMFHSRPAKPLPALAQIEQLKVSFAADACGAQIVLDYEDRDVLVFWD